MAGSKTTGDSRRQAKRVSVNLGSANSGFVACSHYAIQAGMITFHLFEQDLNQIGIHNLVRLRKVCGGTL